MADYRNMGRADGETTVSRDALDTVRNTLEAHDVRLGLVFGSAARDGHVPRDIDVAVEFETHRPGETGYASAYLELYTALGDAVDASVDLVDVHSMGPRFAGSVLEDAELLIGSEQRRSELEATLETESPSLEDARERVATAAERLREGSS